MFKNTKPVESSIAPYLQSFLHLIKGRLALYKKSVDNSLTEFPRRITLFIHVKDLLEYRAIDHVPALVKQFLGLRSLVNLVMNANGLSDSPSLC